MHGMKYIPLVLDQWRDHHPSLYKSYKKDGLLDYYAQKKAADIQDQVASLMDQRLDLHQAEEMVLREEIYHPPEDDAEGVQD